jgi:hypothetical protein
MSVSNEQALSDKSCGLYCPDCELALSQPENWHCPHGETHVSKYAADLLEARELMNKVREEIGQLGLTYKGGGVEAVCNNILEQTKDYA